MSFNIYVLNHFEDRRVQKHNAFTSENKCCAFSELTSLLSQNPLVALLHHTALLPRGKHVPPVEFKTGLFWFMFQTSGYRPLLEVTFGGQSDSSGHLQVNKDTDTEFATSQTFLIQRV